MIRTHPGAPRQVGSLLLSALLLVSLLLAGCGLPLSGGVQRPRTAVPVGTAVPGDIRVLPPGPRGDSTPEAFVAGFLAAQSSPDAAHAIAREFLAAGTRWDDRAGLLVYDPATLALDTSTVTDTEATVVVTAAITGEVRADGSYDATHRQLRENYVLREGTTGWQLIGVPVGLRLATADRDRSFAAKNVFFLAPSYGLTSDTPNLVVDRLFLPLSGNLAQQLIEHLLRGPSAALGGAAETAIPPGTRLLTPVSTRDGTTTVSLSGEAQALAQPRRAQLSAQVVWTLRQVDAGFQHLRLLSDGRPLEVEDHAGIDQGGLQNRADWAEYDPDGMAPGSPLYYVDAGALRTAPVAGDGSARASAASDGSLDIVEAAVGPSGNQLGLVTARQEVLTGPRTGPFTVRLVGAGLSSPTWGSGEQGLWLLREGAVLRLPDAGQAMTVSVAGATTGPFTAMRVSRDGARVALVADQRLWLGRIEPNATGLGFAGVHEVAPGLGGVAGVAWENGTTLVVLARYGTQLLLPVRVAVDGSTVLSAGRAGITGTAVGVAAAPGRQLVLAVLEGSRRRTVSDDGVFFQPGPLGSAPVYPG